MARCDKIETKARRGSQLKFNELRYLFECNGFVLARVSGSHHVYRHESGPTYPIQPGKSGDAKAYQVRECLKLLDRIRST